MQHQGLGVVPLNSGWSGKAQITAGFVPITKKTMCEESAPVGQGAGREAGPGPTSPLDTQCLGLPMLVGAHKSVAFH